MAVPGDIMLGEISQTRKNKTARHVESRKVKFIEAKSGMVVTSSGR